ncbi:MAG: hypothetical protein ACF8R7_15605, partial [Phycisphaerales bacterium JB039]
MRIATIAMVLALPCAAASGQTMPPMGGPMQHLMIERVGDALEVHADSTGPLKLQSYGDTYAAPADVLNGKWFNAQFGWMAEGFWTPPVGASVWIEVTDQTPGLETYRAMTFAPIFTTGASSPRFAWDGRMTHNWYAATAPGLYEASYRIYFGDETTGDPMPGYDGADITLSWELACRADLTGDGSLDFFDFLEFQNRFATGD